MALPPIVGSPQLGVDKRELLKKASEKLTSELLPLSTFLS